MLVGLPGGKHQEGPAPTGAEALARFAQESTDSDGDPLAASVVIEVVGSFLAQVVTARGDAHSGLGESEALASVRATAIIHSLGPCLLLFPFQGVVGSGIVEALPPPPTTEARPATVLVRSWQFSPSASATARPVRPPNGTGRMWVWL